MGASIYATKRDVDSEIVTDVQMIRASDWFDANLRPDDHVIMKLNCEGGEVPIVLDLCETGRIHRIAALLIDFDIRKVTGMEGGELTALEALEHAGFDRYVLAEEVMTGPTHQIRIAAWLNTIITGPPPS